MAGQLKTLVEAGKPGKKVQTTPEAAEFRRLPWHLEPSDKQRLMDQLDRRLKRLADEIHECHISLVLDMQMEIETLSGSKVLKGFEITFRGKEQKFEGVKKAAAEVAHTLYELVPDLSLEEVVVIMSEIDDADKKSEAFLNMRVLSCYHEDMTPVETFTENPGGEYYAPKSKEEWLAMMLGSSESENRRGLAERLVEIDRRALLSAYSDLVRLKIDRVVKEILRKECGREHMRTDWPWPFGYFLIEKSFTRAMMSEPQREVHELERA